WMPPQVSVRPNVFRLPSGYRLTAVREEPPGGVRHAGAPLRRGIGRAGRRGPESCHTIAPGLGPAGSARPARCLGSPSPTDRGSLHSFTPPLVRWPMCPEEIGGVRCALWWDGRRTQELRRQLSALEQLCIIPLVIPSRSQSCSRHQAIQSDE